MNEREVLKMLKSKIDAAAKVGCNHAIETEDEDAINKALNTPAVSGSLSLSEDRFNNYEPSDVEKELANQIYRSGNDR